MSPTWIYHAGHALRRAWLVPARSAIAIAACVLAWLALFDAGAQRAAFEAMQAQAGTLGGYQAYRISLEKAYQEDGRKHASLLPREFVEFAVLNSAASVLKVRGGYAIRGPRDARTTLVDALFYRVGSRDTQRASFPSCALRRAEGEAYQAGRLLYLPPNWRCQLAPFPASLRALDHEASRDTLALPMAALGDIAGRGALGKVETIWLSFSDEAELRALSERASGTYKLNLNVQPVGARMQGQAEQLKAVAGWSEWLAAIGLLGGVGLYVHGVFGAMRRETSLRACIGMPAPALARWLATDVLAQSLLLASISGMLAALAHLAQGRHIGAPQMMLCIAAIELAIAATFAIGSGAAARIIARHPRVGQLVRM